MPFLLQPWLEDHRAVVEVALEDALESCKIQVPFTLFDAMEYSLLGGGKRLRPLLTLAAAEAVGGKAEGSVLDFACALEFVHTYSLVHDDLPAMDDDDLRRGRPTCHKVFGEAMAMLAGDALLAEAFRVLCRGSEPQRLQLCSLLATASGAHGLVGGQADDVREEWPRSLEFLESLHRRKTGALIAVACAGGAVAAGAGEREVCAMHDYGMHLGLAFQIIDDLMDLAGDPVKAGKTKGTDARKGKVTFPALLGNGVALSRARAEKAVAQSAVEHLGDPAAALIALADFAVERDR
ncbi:MAG: polyprenyl synthetase family protein [Deltaproteobacteria bacterium]|nr:polyprenyl synthetase family protein [Deltaproteobacteria bacterium]